MQLAKKNIGVELAFKKIKYYCAYQERSHNEVVQKLYGYGLYKLEVAEMVSKLIEENYLNEERFAIAFAGGKCRINHWGLHKITYELKQKNVSPYCIKKALASIDKDEYNTIAQKLITHKLIQLQSEKSIQAKKSKIQNYMIGKGYDYTQVSQWLQDIF